MTKYTLRNFLCGMFIGIGAILPGVSGGVLAVSFGIYGPFMEMLTNPRRAIPKYWDWIPPLVIGWCVGFLCVAKGIAAAFVFSGTVATWLFIGLIAGTTPGLFREAGRKGHGVAAWVSFCLCALFIFAGLFYISYVAEAVVTPNIWWYAFCGALWGMSVVIPGMTSASVMMALGLYEPVMKGLAELDLWVLGPSLVGMLVAIVLLARFVKWVFHKYYSIAFHGIFGFVAASTLIIIPTVYRSWLEIALSVVCCFAGFGLAFFFSETKSEGTK